MLTVGGIDKIYSNFFKFYFDSLFPTMPRHNYYKVTPMVKEICKKHGIEYRCKPLTTAFYDIFRQVAS